MYPAGGFGVHADGEAHGGRRKSKVTGGADVDAVSLKELREIFAGPRKSSSACVSGEDDVGGVSREPFNGGQAAANYFVGPRKSAVAMCGVGVSGSNGGVGDDAAAGRAAAFDGELAVVVPAGKAMRRRGEQQPFWLARKPVTKTMQRRGEQ